MKKTIPILLFVFLVSHTVSAGGITLGVGIAGGLNYPIAQQDQSKGSIIGFRGRVKVLPGIALEPNIYFTKYGEPKNEAYGGEIEGSKITSYGIDATIGSIVGGVGIKPYGTFGAGYYHESPTKTKQGYVYKEGKNSFGWSAGFGIEVGIIPSLGLDLRGKLVVIPTEGGASDKSAVVTGGINYYFIK
jgi:hypothetical protein